MTNLDESATNQTQFAAVEPILEQVSQPLATSSVVNEAQATHQTIWAKNKPLLILVGVLFVIIVILILALWLLSPQKPMVTEVDSSPTPKLTNEVIDSQFLQAVKQLQTDLTKADPSNDELAFPPVDLTFSL